jgi:hypothetical protein
MQRVKLGTVGNKWIRELYVISACKNVTKESIEFLGTYKFVQTSSYAHPDGFSSHHQLSTILREK